MSETDNAYMTKESGEPITVKGLKVIKHDSSKLVVPNTISATLDLPNSEIFGESGEVFSHAPWRAIFMALWSLPTAKTKLLSLATFMFLRGRTAKQEYKGKCVNVNIPLGAGPFTETQKKIFGTQSVYCIKVNFPSAESKVPHSALTPERLKCVMRAIMVPELIKAKRFPAITESLGYGEMARSLIRYFEILDIKDNELHGSDARDREIWEKFVSKRSFQHAITPAAITSGCFSSKEVYAEDEAQFPGCIWWSGIHALMTDASNKLRAGTVPKDAQYRLQNSNFYGDFKRKLTARGITVANSDTYSDFLKSIAATVSMFMKVGAGMTEAEIGILDTIMNDAKTTVKEIRPALPKEEKPTTSKSFQFTAIGGTDYDSINESQSSMIDSFLCDDEESKVKPSSKSRP